MIDYFTASGCENKIVPVKRLKIITIYEYNTPSTGRNNYFHSALFFFFFFPLKNNLESENTSAVCSLRLKSSRLQFRRTVLAKHNTWKQAYF